MREHPRVMTCFCSTLTSPHRAKKRQSTSPWLLVIHTKPNTLKFTVLSLSSGPESHEHHGQMIVCSGFMKLHSSQDESTHTLWSSCYTY